jgi:hippurate hydrolase
MVREGVLDRFQVREVYALHTTPGLPIGHFATTAGPITAGGDRFRIALIGKGGHAGRPQETRDPIPAAGALIQALQTIVSRDIDPGERLVVSVTQVHAGTAFNIIPDEATIAGTVRSYSEAVRRMALERIGTIAQGVAKTFGIRTVIEHEAGYPASVNDPGRTVFAATVAQEVGEQVATDLAPSMTAEDFAFMLAERPGVFMRIGNGRSPGVHNPAFDFDDRAAPYGASYLARLVERALPLA